ncbi:GNAT family N-acetyltransferase [Rhabdothermincola sp.]|uniref:GNAT family N-acetyltransferase n=1 Tax=Rhabdothermincola sp. TaxID=2820405 RepID=UPI002FE1F896
MSPAEPAKETAKETAKEAVNGEVVVRRARDDELGAVIELASAALGWRAGEPNEALFRWKHLDNPFGRSPMWVAEVGGRLAGFRTFLRWEFRRADGSVARAVRAVDTATHPEFQGRGIFTTLTLGALAELQEEGVDFVYNTPNSQSRPGYLKMGWQVVGRPPVKVRPSSPAALMRMLRARVPAGKWSLPAPAGEQPAAVFADRSVAGLLDAQPPAPGITTNRSPGFLAWRYGLEPLQYRVLLRGSSPGEGLVVYRLRPRGAAVEAVVAEVLVPPGDRRAERALLAELEGVTGADYLIRIERGWRPRHRFVPLPRQGPILTWRSVCQTEMPPLEQWYVVLGDIELF